MEKTSIIGEIENEKKIYDISVYDSNGNHVVLDKYRGKVLLITSGSLRDSHVEGPLNALAKLKQAFDEGKRNLSHVTVFATVIF